MTNTITTTRYNEPRITNIMTHPQQHNTITTTTHAKTTTMTTNNYTSTFITIDGNHHYEHKLHDDKHYDVMT